MQVTERERDALYSFVRTMAPWELFFTGTFSKPCGLFEAGKIFEAFMDREVPRVSYFYAVEKNPGGLGHHIHGLLYGTKDLRRCVVWKKWFDRYGRNRLEPIRNHKSVTDYSTKYVIKEGALWWYRLNDPVLANMQKED